MRFKEAYGGWQERRLTQEEAARLPMVRNLLAAGHEVRAYDVSPDALAEAVKAGAGEAVSLADAVTAAEHCATRCRRSSP